MTQKDTEGQDLNESLVTSGRPAKIAAGQREGGKTTERTCPKAQCNNAGGMHGIPPPESDLKAYLPAKDSAALAAKAFDLFGMESITFISCQSYANSLPQPRQAT